MSVRAWPILLICAFVAPAVHAQTVAEPESVGMSSSRFDRLDAVMRTYVAEKKLAGVVTLVARNGRIVHLSAAGDVRADSIFRLYSMTKPITSTALLMLFEEGRFQLDDPLERYIPEFASAQVFGGAKVERPITIRDVFTHMGGLSYGGDDHPVDAMYREAGIAEGTRPLKEHVAKLARMPLRNQPGTTWRYSYSHDVQAYLVEYFSGMPFDKFLEKRIFTPLGMKDTSFALPKDKSNRLAAMYTPPGGFVGKPPFALEMKPGLERIESPLGAYPAGGSGLVSTADDYFRFAQMLVNGGEYAGVRLLSPRTVELMTSVHVPMGFTGIPDIALRGSGYGLGVSVMVDPAVQGNLGSKGQFGWSGAASTHVIMDPRENLVAILLVQQRPSLLPLRKQFQTLVYQALISVRQ